MFVCVEFGHCFNEVKLASDALLILSLYSTAVYHAPPLRVRTIPIVFVGVIVRLNMETARRTVRTCLTFAMRKTTD